LTAKGLIWLAVSRTKTALIGQDRQISRFFPVAREFVVGVAFARLAR
jgi:hypothetical protein